METVKTPGATSGMRIRQKMVTTLAPSIIALSSRASGMVWKKLIRYEAAVGSSMATSTRAKPYVVFIIFRLLIIR